MEEQEKWYNRLQFSCVLATVLILPFSWRWAVMASLLVVAASVAKVVAEKRIGNPSIGKVAKWSIATPIAYFLMLAAGVIYSADKEEALVILGHRAAVLLLPLCALLTDTGYLGRRHVQLLGYALVLSVVVLLGVGIAEGNFEQVHHSYSSLYALVALTFVYSEVGLRWKQVKVWERSVWAASVVVLTLYIIYANSRAGILCLYGLNVLFTGWLAVRWNWKAMLVAVVLLVGGVWLGARCLPGHVNRLEALVAQEEAADEPSEAGQAVVEESAAGYTRDARYLIMQSAVRTIAGRPLFGYGLGDYNAALVRQYEADGYETGKESRYNAHNQYLEVALSSGVVGVLLLLLYLVAPLAMCWHERKWPWAVVALTFIVMFSLLFESMLNKQSGILFISAVYVAMALIISRAENKFGRLAES